MKKLLICQFYTPNLEYAVKSEAINKKYCETFGIDYFSQTDKEVIDTGRQNRAYTWYKIPLLLDLLKTKEYEYVMYIDADAVFVRDDYNITTKLDEYYDFDFLCSSDFGPDLVNGGVLIFKNTDWSIDFLERVWDSANYISRGRYKFEVWHEQTILSTFLLVNKHDREKTKILSYYDDNAINDHILRKGKTLIYHDLSKIRIDEIYKITTGERDVLTELNLSCSSDRQVGHGYATFYKNYIESVLKNEYINSLKVLDIGGDNGTIFDIITRYYTNIEYYNITPFNYTSSNENCKIFHIPEINLDTLTKFSEGVDIKFDLIISDYNHSCYMRDLIFSIFFDKLSQGGLYVVEDLQTDLEISIPEKNQQYNWGDPEKKSMTDLIIKFNEDSTFRSDYVDFKNLETFIKAAEIFKCLPFSSLLGLIYKK